MVARLVAAALVFTSTLGAQTPQPPAPADYGQWEMLVAQARTGLSPDGTWIAYAINRSNRNNELRFTRIADGKTTTIPFATLPSFSADARWAAYAIGMSESQEEKLRKDKKPIHRKLGLLKLESGETTTIDGIESFAFDASGTQIVMRRYPPEKKDAPAETAVSDEDPPAAATLIVRDLATGNRTKLRERIEPRVQVSPGGRYLLYVHAEHYWTIDTQTRAVANITRNVATSFIDRESDTTAPQKPAFGVAGWTKDDAAVILNDKFDLWEVASDGSRAVRLTDGAAEQVRHRYVRLDPDEEWIDRTAPLHVSLFSLWTKRSGIGRIAPGARGAERVVWHDRMVDRLGKARGADIYAYVMQTFDDSPDIFAGPTLADAKQVTATNAFQSKYAWGRATLLDYKNDRGDRLQGALYYPAGYEPGKKYPMVVFLYERLSDQLHRYVPPSERDPYNASVFTSQGYFFFMPDIVFRPREPGVSVVECIVPAVRKVASLGLIDPARVGVVGHSWGGFDASYLATHSDVFAAAVAGAPITNLVSNYGNHHWSSGIAETDHIETGQQRMEVPLWEDLPAYIRNSAVFNVHAMNTPLLLMFGENDGTVHWFQGVELYNVARRARKDVVMLAYAGEDHGLRKKPNQLDYHRRIIQWFRHYLKNEPAAPWISSGVRHLDREQELKKLKGKKTT